MPYFLRLPFDSGDRDLSDVAGRVLCANFYRWLEAADPAFSEEVHRPSKQRPFSVSPLDGGDNEQCALHVALLDDEVWPRLLAGLRSRPFVDIFGHKVSLAAYGVRMKYASYAQLAMNASANTHIDLRFLTPTCFRAGDYLMSPLPEPRSLYRSWLAQWNSYAPSVARLDEELLEFVRVQVGVANYRLRTETVDSGYADVVGFIGELSLSVVGSKEAPEATLRQLNALADYAEFCGTGWKTTHGMGQTRRIHRGS